MLTRKWGVMKRGDYERFLLVVGTIVMAVWGIAVVAQVILPSHKVPSEVHQIALAVVLGLFGGAAIAGRKPKNGNGHA